jgi:hypothetical protein
MVKTRLKDKQEPDQAFIAFWLHFSLEWIIVKHEEFPQACPFLYSLPNALVSEGYWEQVQLQMSLHLIMLKDVNFTYEIIFWEGIMIIYFESKIIFIKPCSSEFVIPYWVFTAIIIDLGLKFLRTKMYNNHWVLTY